MKWPVANRGFTVTETLVSGSLIAVVLAIVMGMTDQTERLMRGTSAKAEQFQDARVAFETMTRRLSHATLNNYLDFEYETVSQTVAKRTVHVRMPVGYERTAELRFRSGRMAELNGRGTQSLQPTHGIFFQAPNGYAEDVVKHGALDDLLNTWGYFVELNTDEEFLPTAVRGKVAVKKRYRLMEASEPTESLRVYQFQQPRSVEWFRPLISGSQRAVRPLADNVVALVLLPRLARLDEATQRREGKSALLAPNYDYDSTQGTEDPALNSRHQLPPVVQVVMVAIDERSAVRLDRDFKNQAGMGLDYGALFQDPKLLEDDPSTPAEGDGDLAKFTQMLNDRLNVCYRVFSTNVSLRGAKWSRNQEH